MAPINDRNRKWWTVAAMALTTLLVTIDLNGLVVALPTIGRDLDTSTEGLQWTMNAYLLAFAAPTVAAGRLADIFGRRRVLLIGTVVFVVGSSASGLAQSDSWLIAARVVQGLGASAFFAASLSIVNNAFPPEERSRGIGIWAAIGTVGLAIGPLVGGFLTEALSWRWFFLVNVPITLLAIFLTVVAVRESRDESAGRHVDLVGLVAITAGLSTLVFAIQQGPALGWVSPVVIGSLVAAVVLLAVFFLVEPRLRQPLIELNLFGDRGYLGALFKALENAKLTGLLAAAGANLDASERAEVRGLLSGSQSAERGLANLAPEVAEQVERVVREAFVFALDGAMLLCLVVSLLGVLASFLVAGGSPRSARNGKSRVG